MAGPFTSIHRCEEFLHILGIYTTYRASLARTCWGESDRGITCPTGSFLAGTPLPSELVKEATGKFAAARQLACRPIAAFSGKEKRTSGMRSMIDLPYLICIWGRLLTTLIVWLLRH